MAPTASFTLQLLQSTWTRGQDAAGNCGVACTGRDRLQGIGKGIVPDVEVFLQASMREVGGRRAWRRHLARKTEIT